MAARRTKQAPTVVDTGHLRRSSTWAGLRKGDAVTVTGTKLRSAVWAFVAHIRNLESGEEWIEVVGGRPGDHKLRSFLPEQVHPPTSRKGRRQPPGPSLAEAPQLPLG